MVKQFKDLKPGDKLEWQEVVYEKLPRRIWKDRYGFVNCVGPAFYDGDSGHRHIYDECFVRLIEPQEQNQEPDNIPEAIPDWL